MRKFRIFLAFVAIATLGFAANAALSLPAATVAKLKGEVNHPFSALRQANASAFGTPSLAAPLATDGTPDMSLSGIGGWGTLEGPDGTTWFYSQTFTMNPTNKWYYGGSTITIYNDYNEKVWDFSIEIPNETLVNQIQPFGKITRTFFERNTSSYEVMVYVHRIVKAGVATADIQVHSSNGGNILTYEGAESAMLVSEGTSAYSMKERLALAYFEEVDGVETYRFDILRKGNYSEGPNPVVEHSFTIDYNTIHYSDGNSFFIKYIDGKFFYVLSHYEKPYVASYDYNTGEMTYSEDNNFIVEVYDQNYSKIGGLATPVEMGSAIPLMYAFNIFSDNDISFGYYTGDDQLNLVLATYDYVVSTDSYTYFIDAYNAKGEVVKPIASGVSDWKTLGSISGCADQMALLKSNEQGEPFYELLNLPSCQVAGVLTSSMDGRLISSEFDRVKTAGGYKYVIGMGQGGSDAYGNVIASVAWYNSDLTLDRYTNFNLGPNGEMFTPILISEYLNPYIFDTDDDMEYIYIAKIKRTDGSGKIDNVLCIANEDGSLIRKFEGNATDGDYSNGSLLNLGTSHPSLFVAFANSSANTFKIDFFNLPLTKFQGGNGTLADPYLVASAGDLMQVHNNPTAHFKQVADIDLKGIDWSPVDLQGGYDGNGHSVSNLSITESAAGNVGLFGTVTGTDASSRAYIKNLTIVGATISAGDNADAVGVVAGEVVAGEVNNVHIVGASISWDSEHASSIGGIAGSGTFQTLVSNCSLESLNVTSAHAYQTGGVLGKLGNTTHVSNCAVTLTASTRNSLGGIVGAAGGVSADGSITNCHANVELTAQNGIGGIAGSSSRIRIANCYATGSITATCPEYEDYNDPYYSAGGIIGTLATDWNGTGTIVLENCVAALSGIAVADPNNTSARYKAVGRVVGASANDLGMAGYTEKGISKCFAYKDMTINGSAISSADDTTPAGADVTLEELNKDFFETIGFVFGDNADAPWMDAALPVLFFELTPKAACFEYASVVSEETGASLTNTLRIYGGNFTSVEFSSSNEAVATIGDIMENHDDATATVEVVAVANGVATITACVDDLIFAAFKVTVDAQSGVSDAVAVKPAIVVTDNQVAAPDAVRLEIFNISGACVARAQGSTLSVAGLAQGIYVAAATDAAGKRTTLKFAKH